MKLREVLINMLSRTALFEMAFSRQEAWKKVTGIVSPLSYHVIKLIVMPHSRYKRHWKREVYVWYKAMKDIILKPENRRLSLQEYTEWLINQPEIKIDAKGLKQLQVEYPNEQLVVPPSLQADFEHVMEVMCHMLAANEFVDLDDLIK